MRSFLAVLVAFGSLSLTPALAATSPSSVTPSRSGTEIAQDDSVERLNEMFSDEIQETVAACWEQEKVDLSMGASPEGWVVCGDGSVMEGISYEDYMETVGDVMVASTLTGMRVAVNDDPRLTPDVLAVFALTPEGQQMMQSIVQSAILQSGLQSPNRPESTQILSDRVATGLLTNLSDPTRLGNLLGPMDQYSQVVDQFCTAPGMSVDNALQAFPQHDSVQLYSVCIHESGLADTLM